VILRLLNESPIHILDEIRSSVNHGNFNDDVALLMLDIGEMVKKMQNFNDDAIKKIAASTIEDTLKACKSYQNFLNQLVIDKFLADFKQENKIKILNDLNLIQKRLLQIYQDAGVAVHKDN